MDNVVRVEFTEDKSNKFATIISIKPGGSDKTVVGADDAKILEEFLKSKS